jgi:erythromycin esterase-like protein
MSFRFCFLIVFLLTGLPICAQKGVDLTPLDAIVGNKKYVNVGEDSHFMVEVHKFISRAFPYLVEKKGFRVFVFESAWGIDDKLQDFLNSDRATVNGDEAFFLNAFNSKQTVNLLIWVREWNRQHPNDKIQIAGYQPEQPVTDFRNLFALAGKSDKFAAADLPKKAEVCRAGTGEFKTDIEFVISTSQRRRKGQPTYTDAERAGCNQALDALEKFIATNKKELVKKAGKKPYRESAAHLKSLRTYVNTLTYALDYGIANKNIAREEQARLSSKVYGEGDQARWEIFEVLQQTRYKNKKIFFWMHNWHAMKFAPEVGGYGKDETAESPVPPNTVSIGTRMAQKYGQDLVVIGNIVPKAVCKNPVCAAPPVRPDSLETVFQKVFGDQPALVDARKIAAANRALPLNTAGSLYADINQGHFINVVLNRQFDAVLYLPETTATFEDK